MTLRVGSCAQNPGLVPILDTFIAREMSFSDHRDRYRAMTTALGVEGHMQWGEEMP